MKELSIEEKAKAYDELKIKAQELTEDGYIDKLALLDLFPELKESEDERIRKEMISWLKGFIGEEEGCGYTEDEIKERIAWLEKQGKANMGISEATKQKLEDNLNKALEKETPESFNKFLDEQKAADKVEPKFHEGEWITIKE